VQQREKVLILSFSIKAFLAFHLSCSIIHLVPHQIFVELFLNPILQ
jgi:hypothetical protein